MQLVLDWDGTVTEVDTLHMVVERFGDVDVFDASEREIGRTITLRDAIAAQMATITTPLPEVVDWLTRTVRIRAGFHALVRDHDPLIVSAGFHELIAPLLDREGVSARVVAHHVDAAPGGWEVAFTEHAACDVCGEQCKRAAVSHLSAFAFVGDGISDRCVALAADLVFARADLARWLGEQDRPFVQFDDFTRVTAHLGVSRLTP